MSTLDGRRIVVTRAEEQAGALCARLEAAGAVPLRCPTIRILPPESYEALDEALRRLAEYGWIVFTSTNGVRAVVERMQALGMSVPELDRVRVAAAGPRTARALLEHGVHTDFVPGQSGSEALSRHIAPVEGQRVLLPRGNLADAEAGRVLRERGAAAVDEVVAYRTVPLPPSPLAGRELSGGIDAITFTSPSTVLGFVQAAEWPRWVEGAVVATIGPTTTAAAREAGLTVHVEAEEQTMAGLVSALADSFARRGGGRGAGGADPGPAGGAGHSPQS